MFLDEGQVLVEGLLSRCGRGARRNIPYALAVSFEIGVEANIQVYEQVRTRLATPVQALVNGD
jgi:hypothetical protein